MITWKCSPALFAVALVNGAWAQSVDDRLQAIHRELTAGPEAARDAGEIARRVQAVCGDPAALPRCEQWAVAIELREEPAYRAGTAALFAALRALRDAVPGPLSETAAALRVAEGAIQLERSEFAAAEAQLREGVTALERLRPGDWKNALALGKLGEALYQRNSYPEAETVFRRALDLLKDPAAPPIESAKIWGDLGILYESTRDYGNAEQAHLRDLEIRKKDRPADDPSLAPALVGLADLYSTLQRYQEAESLYLQALPLARRVSDDYFLAAVQNNLGELYMSTGKFAKAAEFYQVACEAIVKIRGRETADAAVCIDNQAGAALARGDFASAVRLRLESVAIHEKVNGPDDPATALAVNNLASTYYRAGKLRESEEAFRRALASRRKALKPEHPDIAASMRNLARALYAQAMYAKAEPLYRDALAIEEATLPADSLELAWTHDGLGNLCFWTGNYVEAETHLRRALEIRTRALGPEHPDTAGVLTSLALLYGKQGAYARAEQMQLRALQVTENAYGPKHRETAVVAFNLGQLYVDWKAFDKAEPQLRRACDILKQAPEPSDADLAAGLNGLASLYVAERNAAAAETVLQEAIAAARRAGGAGLESVARAQVSLGVLRFAAGDYAAAEALYAQALPLLESAAGKTNPDVLGARIDYSRALWFDGRRAEARRELIEINRSAGTFFSRTLAAVEGERRESLARKFDDLLAVSLTIADASVKSAPSSASTLAAVAIGARKGLRSSAGQEVYARIRRERDPQALALFRDLRAITEQQGRLSREFGHDAQARLEQLRLQAEEKERQLIAHSSGYRQWRAAVEPAQVRAALPSDAAFIDILRYPHLDLATGERAEYRYVAVVYRKQQPPRLVSLGASAPIEKAAGELRLNFTNMWRLCSPQDHCAPGAPRILISGPQYQANLARTLEDCGAMYALAFARLAPWLGGATRLILSPDAALAEVPWEAFRAGRRYLVEDGYRITYVDSAHSLVNRQPAARPRAGIAVIAQVDYDGKTAAPVRPVETAELLPEESEETLAGDAGAHWLPLAGGDELLRALSEWQRDRKLAPIDKLPAGSEEEVLALHGPAAFIAHTHGFFRAGAAQGAAGLASGIVLYGANRPAGRRAGRDGWFTAREIMLADLAGTRLAALVGCDTGRGVEAGEGVQGLRHALAVAGARSTLLTLWEVGDRSSARFLREFLIRSTSVPMFDAIAATRLGFLRGEVAEPNRPDGVNRWQHPYFWAAPTLAGEGGVLDLR